MIKNWDKPMCFGYLPSTSYNDQIDHNVGVQQQNLDKTCHGQGQDLPRTHLSLYGHIDDPCREPCSGTGAQTLERCSVCGTYCMT